MSAYVDKGLLQVDVVLADLKFALVQLKKLDNQKAGETILFVLKDLKELRRYSNCTAIMKSALGEYIDSLDEIVSSLCSNLDLKPPIKMLKKLVKRFEKETKRINKGKSKSKKSSGTVVAIFGLVGLCFIMAIAGATVGDVFIAIGIILFIAVFWKVILWVIAISIGVSAISRLRR